MVHLGNRSALPIIGEHHVAVGDDAAGTFPLSGHQQSLWAERRTHPNVPLHNILLTARLTGELDTERLRRAYRTAVEHLDFLRISIDESQPRQRLTVAAASEMDIIEIPDHTDEVDGYIAEFSNRVFDLAGPLYQVSLIRRSSTEHVLCGVFDGLCADESSALLFVDYLGDLYEGRNPVPPRSFREFAEDDYSVRGRNGDERTLAAAPQNGQSRDWVRFYGRTQSGATPVLRRAQHDFGAERGAALTGLIQQSEPRADNATTAYLMWMTVLLLALVSRTSDHSEVVVAVPRSPRRGPLAGAMGPLGDEVELHIELAAGETFQSLFDKVDADLAAVRRDGRAPAQPPAKHVSVRLIDTRQSTFGTLECHAHCAPIWTTPGARFDGTAGNFSTVVQLGVHQRSALTGALPITFDFPVDLLSEDQRQRAVGHVGLLLDALLDNPRRVIADVDLVSGSERAFVLASAHGPDRAPAADLLHQIADHCRRHPTKTAVVQACRSVTYHQLAESISALASRLSTLGVGPGARVAVSMPRGVDELITMLAVLAAGGAYVPLDPAQPKTRLEMIVDDACPTLLIATHGHQLVEKTVGLPTLLFEDLVLDPPGADHCSSWHTAEPESMAYVLFTSGSTGRPKGVGISRAAMSNFLASMVRSPGLCESDLVLAVATTMFDIAVLEMFGPLYVGATVHIVDSATAQDSRRLRAVVEREPISVLQATPTRWRALIDAGWRGNQTRLRMLVGGEALSTELAEHLMRYGELWNMYGPTETTVWATQKRIDDAGVITVGRPVDRAEVYVLDGQGRLAPIGVLGELCIGGAGVSQGYLDRPELTAEKFIQNPFGPPGSRIYRTGDVGRLREDGEFECVGRLDHQIKIRGFRVELGEIEARLDELAAVNKAVVTLHTTEGREPRLVAFVVPAPGSDFSPRLLAAELRGRLPSYMLPAQYIWIDEFPMTPTAKIDRRALPDPDDVPDSRAGREWAAPRTATEQALLGIWTRVLGVPGMAVDDDFFESGGQSVLAVRIFDEIHRTMGVDLPLAVLFSMPTIASLGRHIDGIRRSASSAMWTTVVPIEPSGSLTPMFCVSGAGGNPMTFRRFASALGDEQPFYGLQHRGVDGKRQPHQTVRGMAEEFVTDIRDRQPNGPYVLAGYSAGGLAAYEAAQLLLADGEHVELLVLFDTVHPLLDGWSISERKQAHWSNLRVAGPRYLVDRTLSRLRGVAAGSALKVRAGLAAHPRFRYRYRLEALAVAHMRGSSAYRPSPYPGHVLLIRCDGSPAPGGGIARKAHESNGWREYVSGRLDVVTVPAGHLDLFDGATSDLVAAEVSRVLRNTSDLEARERV
jgi:amino acid adenylation domain-containing protein